MGFVNDMMASHVEKMSVCQELYQSLYPGHGPEITFITKQIKKNTEVWNIVTSMLHKAML